MPVYIIKAVETGRVKIGFTADATPRRRLAKMQTDNHERLTILRWLDGDENAEAKLQDRYIHLRIRGDWFHFCETMMGDLGVTNVPPPAPTRYSHILRQYIADEGLTVPEFAAAIGVSIQAIHRYATGERFPRRKVMLAIIAHTKGAVQPSDLFAQLRPSNRLLRELERHSETKA